MSRSGYTDDGWDDESAQWASIRYNGALKSAIRGKKGQAFLKDLLAALDAMPEKRLIREQLVIDGDQSSYIGDHWGGATYPQVIVGADELCATDGTVAAMGDVCALGALGRRRGIDMSSLDPEDIETVADSFGVNEKIAREIVYHNDEVFDREWVNGRKTPDGWVDGYSRVLTPEERWQRMRDWVASLIKPDEDRPTAPKADVGGEA